MPNTASVSISSPQGVHNVFLQQEEGSRTIDSRLDGASHPLTGCSASKDGTVFQGGMVIRKFLIATFHDQVTVAIDPDANTVKMTIAGDDVFSGVLGPGQAAALITFVKACNLPSLVA